MRPLLKRIYEGESPSNAILGYMYYKGKDISPYKSTVMRDCTYIRLSFCPTVHTQFEFLFYRESNIRNTKQ